MHKRARGLHEDPLSAASAGLLALGVDRSRRAEALELLAAMLDLADDDGDVLLDGALFAVEQRMGVEKSLEVYAWLETLDVVQRTSTGWRINAYAAHNGPGGETLASLEVLRRHLDSVGQPDPAAAVEETLVGAPNVVRMPKWRRAVPMAAAGLAASVAVVGGVTRFVPQAAVTGQHAAQRSERASQTIAPRPSATTPGATVVTLPNGTPITLSPVTPTVTPTGDNTATTGGPTDLTGAVVCAIPNVVTSIKGVELVRLPLAGENGESIWAAVVSGTATLTEATEGLLLPALEVVAHVIDGDTAPVLATLTSPLLLPNLPTPFTAVVALGGSKPTVPVTATAVATGFKSC